MKTKYLSCLLLALVSSAHGQQLSTLSIEWKKGLTPTGNADIGGCMDVAQDAKHLYAIGYGQLTILSLDNPAQPKPIGKLGGLGNTRQIAIRGNTAFITAREDGLFVVNVSDRFAPKLVSRYDTIEFATGIAVKDNYVFVACRQFGVEIIDAADPAHLKHTSIMRVGEAQSCEVSDGYLYAGAWGERRVAICDVRNPAAPKLVAEVKLGGKGDGVCVRDGVLYAPTGQHPPGCNDDHDNPKYGRGNGMDIFDVSNPASPRRLSRVQFNWQYYYPGYDTWRVRVALPYAYLIHAFNGVYVLDVSNPRAPKEVAQIHVPISKGEKNYRQIVTPKGVFSHPPVLPFKTDEVVHSPVCGLALVDGQMYLPGDFSDLHIFRHDRWAKALPLATKDAGLLKPDEGSFHDLPAGNWGLKNLRRYNPGGQVYAAVEDKSGLIYAACGSAGIHVLNQELKPVATYPPRGFTVDLQLADGKLYSAESSGGLACCQRDGARLKPLGAYVSKYALKQIRLSGNGRFIVAHAGGNGFEFLDVSDVSQIRLLKMERCRNGGLVYFRQLCNGFVDGKFICGYRNSGDPFWADFSGTEPKFLPDIEGLRLSMQNGYAACGEYALATHKGGYVYYKPQASVSHKDLLVYRITDGPQFLGKPATNGKILTVCDRFTGDVTVVNISDLTTPKLICRFRISGSPDCAFVADDHILLPAGYQGLFRFEL